MRAQPHRSRGTTCSRYCPSVRAALLIIALIACTAKKERPPKPQPAIADAAAPATRRTADVHVDKRVELLSILFRLTGANEYRTAPMSPYVADVDKTFGKFRDHPAVEASAALRTRHGIAFDAPMLFAIHLDDNFQLRNPGELAELDARWRGVDVDAYAKLVRAFATDTRFDAFLARHAGLYEQKAKQWRDVVEAEQPIGFFEELFGPRPKARHIVVPGLLTGTRNFGVRVTLADGSEELFQILGATGGPPDLALLVHEMAHSYVDPLIAKHAAALRPAGEALFARVADTMRAQHYVDWQTVLDESGVRAVTVLFMRERKGDRAGAAQARNEMRAGFVWIHELVEMFRKYHRDRTSYRDFDAYMPKLVAFFDELAQQYATAPPKLPFIGPFDAVVRSDYVLVLPKSGPVVAYVDKLPFFTDRPRAHAVVDGKAIVAYGTPASNPAVAQAAAWGLWKITDAGIELGAKRFAGDHLVLVACWFRRDDPSRGIAVYAAADERDLVGINHGLKHGGTDWLVARKTAKGYEVIEAGDWPIENGAWVPFSAPVK